jgi:hypothetical protein
MIPSSARALERQQALGNDASAVEPAAARSAAVSIEYLADT